MIGLGISLMPRGGQSLHPAVATLVAAMTPAPTAPRVEAINALVVALDAAGVWNKLDAFYALAAHHQQAARLNWRNPATFTLSAVNSPTFVVDRGYNGNGTSSYLDTGFNPVTAGGQFTLNSGHQAVVSRTDGAFTVNEFGNANNRIICRTATDLLSGRMMIATTPLFFPNNTNGTGHFCMSRTSSGAFTYLRNGVSLGSSADAAVALTSANFWIGASSNLSYSTRQISAAHWGSGLTDAETLATHNAIAAYNSAIGA